MNAKLLLDEMYPPSLAQQLIDKGNDVVAVAGSLELAASSDPIVLDSAREAERCLVTENVRDFAALAQHTRHAGLLLVHARRWPRTRPGLHALTEALHALIADDRVPGKDEVSWLHR